MKWILVAIVVFTLSVRRFVGGLGGFDSRYLGVIILFVSLHVLSIVVIHSIQHADPPVMMLNREVYNSLKKHRRFDLIADGKCFEPAASRDKSVVVVAALPMIGLVFTVIVVYGVLSAQAVRRKYPAM